MENTHPLNRDFWKPVLSNDTETIENLKANGEKMRLVQEKIRSNFAKSNVFEIDFEGLKVIACNKRDKGSLLFESLENIEDYDIMMSFQYCGKSKLWEFSIYSTKPDVNCSEIAKKYGGGGHPGAAGFSQVKLPFNI